MQNFGKITNAFNGILADSIVSKDSKSKQLFKKYIKTIKENNILKTQFFVYDNLENKVETDDIKAAQYLQENINLLKAFNKEEIFEANLNLAKPILFEQADGNYSKESLHENIAKLVFMDRTPKNIDSIIEATNNIISYIKEDKTKEITESIDLPMSMISTIMIDKYNERYNELSESDRQILKVLMESTDDEKKEIYTKTIRECIDLINEKLNGSDLDSKDKLLRVKDKLLNDKVDIDENFSINISKLVELKETLIEN